MNPFLVVDPFNNKIIVENLTVGDSPLFDTFIFLTGQVFLSSTLSRHLHKMTFTYIIM